MAPNLVHPFDNWRCALMISPKSRKEVPNFQGWYFWQRSPRQANVTPSSGNRVQASVAGHTKTNQITKVNALTLCPGHLLDGISETQVSITQNMKKVEMQQNLPKSGTWWYLVQGTFLPPNGSISNITGWKLVDPTSGEIPRLFWIQKIRKSPNWGLKFQGRVILEKKGPCQEACKQSSGVGKHPQMVNPSKFNPGFGQKHILSKSQEKVPTNTANWSCGLINSSGHLYFYDCSFCGCLSKMWIWDMLAYAC